jgi:hypothetical protein
MRRLTAFLLASACSAFGQTYTISTFAGGALPVNIPGTSAGLGTQGLANTLRGIAVDSVGNTFITTTNAILRLDAATGLLTLFAGNGISGFSGDNGPATSAQLSYPRDGALVSAGRLAGKSGWSGHICPSV